MSKTFNDVFTEFTEGYIIGRGGEVHPERLGIPATYVKDLYPDLLSYKAVAQPMFGLIVATAPGGSLYHPDGWDETVNDFYLEAQHLFYLMEATGLRAKIQDIYLPAMSIDNAASYITQYNNGTYSIKNYLHLRSALIDMNIEVWDTLFCYGMETIRLYQEPTVVGSDMPLTTEDHQWFQRLLAWFTNIYKLETKTLA